MGSDQRTIGCELIKLHLIISLRLFEVEKIQTVISSLPYLNEQRVLCHQIIRGVTVSDAVCPHAAS